MIAPAPSVSSPAFQLVELLIGLLEYRDPHYRSGSSLARIIAEALGVELCLSGPDIQALTLAASLRDISRLINPAGGEAPRAVEPDEETLREIHAQVHTTLAMLHSVELPPLVMEAIRHHHERWDGTGYPAGLAREDIPLLARVLSVADAFAAILSPRPHRPPLRVRAALDELLDGAGHQHDPEIVNMLARLVALGDSGPLAFLEHRRLLIAHPSRQQASLLAARIGTFGYLAETAHTPAEASTSLKRSPVSVLVISADLPGTDPEVLIRGLRENEHYSKLIVLAVQVARASDRIRLLDAGADGCFADDLAAEELRAILASVHRGRGTGAAAPRAAPAASSWHVLEGDLRSFPLPWVLQALRYDSRTGAVHIQGPQDEIGTVSLDRGDPVDAEVAGVRGDEALRRMLRWPDGRFVVEPQDAPPAERTIHTSLMDFLLSEAVATDHAILGAVRV